MAFPDLFLAHGKPEEQYEEAGLTAQHIEDTIRGLMGDSKFKVVSTTQDPD